MIAHMPTIDDYRLAFVKERANEYYAIDAFERRMGYAIDRQRLEHAAAILACPVKANPPNWQHGRVIYAATRNRLGQASAWESADGHSELIGTLLDIGTAKGFSALCMQWAVNDHLLRYVTVTSIDVIDPLSEVRRNTVLECHQPMTLMDCLGQWKESRAISFIHDTSIHWLETHWPRIQVAFVDGKHDGDVVKREGQLLADRQQPGDVVVFDDVQIPSVEKAVRGLIDYDLEYLAAKPERIYAIGVRR